MITAKFTQFTICFKRSKMFKTSNYSISKQKNIETKEKTSDDDDESECLEALAQGPCAAT